MQPDDLDFTKAFEVSAFEFESGVECVAGDLFSTCSKSPLKCFYSIRFPVLIMEIIWVPTKKS